MRSCLLFSVCALSAPLSSLLPAAEPAVVVTGSNLPLEVEDARALPLFSLTPADGPRNAFSTAAELLQRLPQTGAGTFDESGGGLLAPGGAGVALRGLSANSTLTLLNGRRVAAYPFPVDGTVSFVDLNSLPVGAIDRIDVFTGSGAALYGSDAIAGVVNVVLRREFTGVEINAVYGNTTEKDASDIRLSLASGWKSDTTRLAFFADYQHRNDIQQTDRDFSFTNDLRPRGGSELRSSVSNPGSVRHPVTGNFLRVPADSDGTITAADLRSGTNRFDRAPFTSLVPKVERYGALALIEQKLSSAVTLFGEVALRRNRTSTQGPATPIQGDEENIFVPANNPFNPFTVPVTFRYRVTEAGQRLEKTVAENLRLLGGLRVNWNQRWTFETAAWFDRTEATNESSNNLSRSAVIAALNQSSPSAALNVFGAGNAINNPAVIEGLKLNVRRDGSSQLFGTDARLSGPVFELPGGSVVAQLGLEFRDERVDDRPDARVLAGDVIDYDATAASGNRQTFSAHTEFRIPIVGKKNAFVGVQELTLTAAGRVETTSDYGTSVVPQVTLSWRPCQDLTLSGGFGLGFRAPSLVQLYTGQVSFSRELTDTARFRVTGSSDDQLPLQVVSGGNRDLQAEDSEHWWARVNYAPSFAKGLQFSATFWRIDQRDIVAAIDPQFILDNEARFPGLVTRVAPSADDIALGIPGKVALINSTFQNLARVQVEGVDLTADYTFSLFGGRTDLGVNLAYLHRHREVSLPGQPAVERAGTYLRPHWRGQARAAWERSGFRFVAVVNAIERYADFRPGREVSNSGTLDLEASYQIPKLRSTLTVGVVNALGADAPFSNVLGGYPAGLESARGRYVYGGVKVKY